MFDPPLIALYARRATTAAQQKERARMSHAGPIYRRRGTCTSSILRTLEQQTYCICANLKEIPVLHAVNLTKYNSTFIT